MSVLTRDLVKTHLVIDSAVTKYDSQIDVWISRAETAVARRIGPLAPTAASESHDGGFWLVKTLNRPIISITSLAESYGTYNRTLAEQPLDGSQGFTAYGYTVEKDRGVIERRVSGVASPFASGRRNVVVSYTAGWTTDGTTATMPDDLELAILELIRSWWEASQRGGNVAPGRDPQPTHDPGIVDAFPPAVETLLQLLDDDGIA